MGDELRQALADAARVHDRGLSSLCRALLREGLVRLDNEGIFLSGSVRPRAACSDTNEIDGIQYLADNPGGEQTVDEQKGHRAIVSFVPPVQSIGSQS